MMSNNTSGVPVKPLSEQPIPLEQRLRRRHRELLGAFDESKILRTQQNDAAAADRLVSLRTDLSNHRMNSETKIVNISRQTESALNKLNACCGSPSIVQEQQQQQQQQQRLQATSVPPSTASTPLPAAAGNYYQQQQQQQLNRNLLPFGPDDRLPQDDIHGLSSSKPENGEEILSRRRDRLTAARLEIIQLAIDLRDEHTSRMEKLDSLENALFNFEHERQNETERLTRDLVENIISIAYVNVTQAQSIAQQYLIEENERALANNVGMTSLFSKLRQHELLHFREMMKSVRGLMRKTEERCVKSILVWSMNLLLSKRFREPKGRADLIERTREMVLQSGRNLKHIVGSITAAAESLPRKPRPTATVVPLTDIYKVPLPLSQDRVPCDVPGGTGDGGWLKHFSLDDPRAIRPFVRSAKEVTMEWTQALETVLDHFGTGSEEIILESQQHGRMINEMVEDILFAAKRDIAHCFTLGPVEIQMKKKQSKEYFPLLEDLPEEIENKNNNNNNNNNSTVLDERNQQHQQISVFLATLLPPPEAARDEYSTPLSVFFDHFERIQNEIKQENKWFTDFIALHLLRQYELANNLIHRNGFYALCTESTAFLQSIVEKICSLVRSAVLWQEESQKNFRDTLTRLEKAYQITEDRLASAGTIAEATELCEQAAGLLKKIDEAYVGNFARSEEYLAGTFVAKLLPQLLDHEIAQQIFAAVCVSPVDLKQLRHDEDEYLSQMSTLKKQREADEQQQQRQQRRRSSSPNRGVNSPPVAKKSSVSAASGAAASKTTAAAVAALEEKAKKENEIAERQRLLNLPSIATLRGSTFIITAPVDSVMELGGSKDAYLAEQIEDKMLIEQKRASINAESNAAKIMSSAEQQLQQQQQQVHQSTKRMSTKMTKAQKEELERLKLEEHARREEAESKKRLLPVEERYIGFLTREFSTIFTPNCLLPASSLASYITLLRALLLDWFEEYKENILAVSRAYAKTTIDQLSLETHECIRRHARRPVTLQSQVYEVRIRQLQDAADARADWFERLLQRVRRGLEHAQRGVADLEVVDSSTSAAIEDIKEEVCEASSVAALDAQKRSFVTLLTDSSNSIKSSLDATKAKAFETFYIVRTEVESFEVHKLKSLEEGGQLTVAEKESCSQAVRDVYDAIKQAEADVSNLAETTVVHWGNKCSSWEREFDDLLDVHRKEVTFLKEIAEALSKARGAISVMLSASCGAHQRLTNAVGALELFASSQNNNNNNSVQNQQQQQVLGSEFIVPPRSEGFSHLKSVIDFSKMSFVVSASTPSASAAPSSFSSSSSIAAAVNAKSKTATTAATKTTTIPTSPSVPASHQQQQHHQQFRIYERDESNDRSSSSIIDTRERIHQALRQHRIMSEKQLCTESRAAKLSQLITSLRDMFCERGLALGCLSNVPEWSTITTNSGSGSNNNNNIAMNNAVLIGKDWLSLESTRRFMQNNMVLFGLVDPNQQQQQQQLVDAGLAKPNSIAQGQNLQSRAPPATTGTRNQSASTLLQQPGEASVRNAIGALFASELPSTDVLLPPMRSTTTRLEWLAQRILDKTEREINRLVTAHFSRPASQSSPSSGGTAMGAPPHPASAAGASPLLPPSSTSVGGAAPTSTAAGLETFQSFSSAAKSKKEREAAAAAAFAAQQIAAQEALAAANKLTRETEFGQDANSIKERVSKLLIDQLGRVTDHVEENTNDYRILVRKLQVSIHGAAEELFSSLLQFQLGALNESVRIILDDFAHFYKRILEEQRQIQQNLRAPLASPAHAKAWAALCQREAARRSAAKYELQQVAANFATEIIQSERVANARVAQALASFFALTKSFILIRHLEGVDSQVPETGKHRGLRRLMRMKLREEAGGPKVVSDGNANDNQDNDGSKGGSKKKALQQQQKNLAAQKGAAVGKQGGKNVGTSGGNANFDPAGNAGGNPQDSDVPDPIPPPPLQPQAQIPPVALAGLTTGRTLLPAQKPDEPSSASLVAAAAAAAAAARVASSSSSGGGSTSNSKQQQKELAAALQQQQEAAAAKKKQEDEDTIARIFMTVANEPASWFDEPSQQIFKMIVAASLNQQKEQLELLQSQQQQQQLQAGGASGDNAIQIGKPRPFQQQQQQQQATTSSLNKAASSASARQGGSSSQTMIISDSQQKAAEGHRSYFDPSLPFKTPNYAAPASATATSSTVTLPPTLASNGQPVVVPLPTPSETRIFPVAYSSAQLTIDKMDQVVTEAANVLYAKLKQFEEVEQRWVVSWNGAVETLGASVHDQHHPAAAGSTNSKQLPPQQQQLLTKNVKPMTKFDGSNKLPKAK